jgi:hypothetical protein
VLYGSLDEFSKNWPVPGISKKNQNQRIGQFQAFQKKIRIQELVTFMKELVVLSQFFPSSLTFRPFFSGAF